MKYLKSLDSFDKYITEKRVAIKRRYTESHPAKNISTAARVRNSVIEAMGDGVLTEEELSKILQELKAHKRWLGRNTKLFNISEDQNGIKSYTLSPFGKRVKAKTITVNEASRWKGKDLYPNWVKPGDINTMPVKNINDLTVGLSYVIRDYGDDAYHGDYELREVGKNYVFVDSAMHSQGGEMIFTKKEMLDAIKSGDIYEQD